MPHGGVGLFRSECPMEGGDGGGGTLADWPSLAGPRASRTGVTDKTVAGILKDAREVGAQGAAGCKEGNDVEQHIG